MKYVHPTLLTLFLTSSIVLGNPIPKRTQTCGYWEKRAACEAEIRTIRSHTAEDAAEIPLAESVTRTFIITLAGLNFTSLPPVNVGLDAATTRLELVALATVLNAGVPEGSDSYILNANGSMTSDFIQVREIHEFNEDCEITSMLGYVNGPLVDI